MLLLLAVLGRFACLAEVPDILLLLLRAADLVKKEVMDDCSLCVCALRLVASDASMRLVGSSSVSNKQEMAM